MRQILLLILFSISLGGYSQNNKDTTIRELETKISKIENALEYNNNQQEIIKSQTEIIEKVEGFYDRSWSKLIWVIGILGTLVGLILPYFTNQKFQNDLKQQKEEFEKQLEKQKEEFEKNSKERILENENKLKEYSREQYNKLKEEINIDIASLDKYIKENINNIWSTLFFHMAITNMQQGYYDKALNCLGRVLDYELNSYNISSINSIIVHFKSVLDMISKENNQKLELEPMILKNLKLLKSMRLEEISEKQIDEIINSIKEISNLS